jgi:CheY-like chemotaxis protein
VVDDAPDILEYFQELAERIGIFCDIAPDGQQALKKIKENGSYDIYFVDWKMPGMDGIELSRQITAGGQENTVVIMISAQDWNSIEEEAQAAGIKKFIQKPLFASTIADCINECLGIDSALPRNSSALEMTDYTGCRILLAEDIEINREIVLTILEPSNLGIDCAENGVRAVEMFSAAPEKYDMIFMDIHMPEMDGYEATRRIRAIEKSRAVKQIPIIAMTANVFREDIEKCLAAGMDNHIGKPINFEDVMRMFQQYLRKNHSG